MDLRSHSRVGSLSEFKPRKTATPPIPSLFGAVFQELLFGRFVERISDHSHYDCKSGCIFREALRVDCVFTSYFLHGESISLRHNCVL